MGFGNAAELKNLAIGLDRAEERQVLIFKQDEPLSTTKEYKGIWNVDKGHLSCIASKKYHIIQHREAFTDIAEALTEMGLTLKGNLNNLGDRVVADIIWQDREITTSNNEKVKFGVRLINSYDKTHSFMGELWAFRLVCSNGMVLGKAFGEVKFKRWHMGDISVRKEIRAFMNQAAKAEILIKQTLDRAILDSIEWQYVEPILNKIIATKKYRLLIEKELSEAGKLSRWDLYNAITSVATHGESLTVGAQEYLQNRAQEILMKTGKELVALAMVKDDGKQ